MTVNGDLPLDRLDVAVLTPFVRRALHQDTAELLTWQGASIAYDVYLPGRMLMRFSGLAAVEGVAVPWSLVLKKTSPPVGDRRTSEERWRPSEEGWRRGNREALAFRSGLLDDIPGPLTAARAIAVADDEEGAIWLWLEEVSDHFDHDWPLVQYGRAARHLGHFNGAYLIERPLPTFPWLMPSWAEHHSAAGTILDALPQIEALASDARVRRAFPVPIAELAPQLLRDEPLFIRLLGRLPQTLCHHDASGANLFARPDANGTLETVAIDWEMVGPGAVGAEIATLVFGTIRRGDFSAERVAELDREVFAGYLAGLHDAGWRGDPELVRLGYTAAIALRWFQLRGTLRALTDGAAPARRGRAPGESGSRALDQFIRLSLYLLACADEACRLARQFSLIS